MHEGYTPAFTNLWAAWKLRARKRRWQASRAAGAEYQRVLVDRFRYAIRIYCYAPFTAQARQLALSVHVIVVVEKIFICCIGVSVYNKSWLL